MGIDAEHVLVCIWKFIRFLINTSYIVCVQKHPFVSCTLLVTFLIYISFNLLLYHLPFLVFVTVLLRLFWRSERQQNHHRVKEREKSAYSSLETNNKAVEVEATTKEIPSFRRQKSRRTYFSKNINLSGNTSTPSSTTSQACSYENDTKPPVVPENKKAKLLHHDDDRLSFRKPNYFSSEDDSEEINVKAVEWNEEDQKNLDNLGVSEIERNRRLESLIAKRRARNSNNNNNPDKPPSSQGKKPILTTTRINDDKIIGDCNGRVPGSAPSLVAAGKNPFDIPYDPTEEKPDLTADSLFDQDIISGLNNINPMYCRHESFSYGGFVGDRFESERDRREANLSAFFGADKRGLARTSAEIAGSQRPTQAETANDTTVSEQDTINDMENENNMDVSTVIEADTEPSIVEDSETTSSSSFDMSISNRSMEAIASLESMQGYYHEDSANDKNRNAGVMEDRFLFGNKFPTHTPSYSIASDLQVEVSEIDSPPLTAGNVSPNDGDSLSFDDEMERARLNFDMESLDDINQALERVGNSTGSLDELANENRETTTLSLAERLSSHPFSESVYGTTKRTLIRSGESVEKNTVDETRESGMIVTEDKEKHENEDNLLINEKTMDNLTMVQEGNPQNHHQHHSSSDSSLQQPTIIDSDRNLVKNNNHEEAKDDYVPTSNKIDLDLRDEKRSVETESVERQHESLVEEVVVNSSLPSSPISTTVRLIPNHKVFSLNLGAKLEAQPADHVSPITTHELAVNSSRAQCSNSGEFEPQEVWHKVELVIEDKAGTEESKSNETALEISSE